MQNIPRQNLKLLAVLACGIFINHNCGPTSRQNWESTNYGGTVWEAGVGRVLGRGGGLGDQWLKQGLEPAQTKLVSLLRRECLFKRKCKGQLQENLYSTVRAFVGRNQGQNPLFLEAVLTCHGLRHKVSR